MSKTDKTNPYWVQLRQNPAIREEHHNHANNVCDLDISNLDCYTWRITRRARCTYSFKGKYCYTLKYYDWRGTWFESYVDEYNGGERARVRMASHEIRKLTDYEDYDFPNYQHRHGARWDAA